MTPAQQVSELIDSLGHPSKMLKPEWVDFLEEVVGDCEEKATAAREEMAEDEEEDGG